MRDYYAKGRASGLLLAKQGFVTLSIDLLGDGERIEPGHRSNDTRPFYQQRYPDPMADDAWSIIGKSVWDVMRSVDYLQSLDYVSPNSIGCTGWSYGGHVTLFAAAFDQRIAAAVPNGGVLDWDRPKYPEGYRGKPKANAWCRQPATMEPWTAMARKLPPVAPNLFGAGDSYRTAARFYTSPSSIATPCPRIVTFCFQLASRAS